MNFSSASSCFHNLFSGQGLCSARDSLARQAWQPWESEGAQKIEEVGSLAMVAGQLQGGPMRWPLGSLVMLEKTTDTRVVVNGCLWQVSLRGSQARDRMLIPGETAQPSVPIWALLVVHDGKEKYLSLHFPSPVKSTLT